VSSKILQWKDLIQEASKSQGSKLIKKTKVCIIGSGCGGATLGALLAKRNIDVIVIEQGGYYPTATFDNHELTMAGKLSGDRNLATTSDNGINLLYGNNVGGASVHYWADSYRTPKDRLEYWESEFGIQYHDTKKLTPFWNELDKRLNVHPAEDSYLNPMNRLVEKGAKILGWKGHRVPQARKNCQKSGHCMQGCAFGAKQSQLVTHIEDILEHNGFVFSDLRAIRLVWNEKQTKVISLICKVIDRPSSRETDTTVEIQAEAFVVACGGFGSSTFLLRNGLKKKLPALGEYVSINPSPMVHGLYPIEIVIWRNIPAGFGIDEFRLAEYDSKGNYLKGGYLIMPNQLQPGTLAAMIPLTGENHYRWMKQISRIGGTIGWIDDVPEELGRIYLSENTRKVYYPILKQTSLILKDLIRKQVELQLAVGAQEVLIANHKGTIIRSRKDLAILDSMEIQSGDLMMGAPHPAGGCRMGEDPAKSVVDSRHRLHGALNLYVADSSVFPTGVSVDPSYTIMAFSYVAFESIMDQLS